MNNSIKKKVLVWGHFNVIHPGHIRLLNFAKKCGDELIVAIESDRLAGSSAYIKEDLRLEGIKNIGLIDEAFIFDQSPIQLILELRPDIVVKGKEHEHNSVQEEVAVKHYGGKLIFSSGDTFINSSDLLDKELASSRKFFKNIPKSYVERHEIKISCLEKIIRNFKNISVLVLGDIIIDEYINCHAIGLSQEEPTLVVAPTSSNKFLGGAGIVAAHAASMGARVKFMSVTGDDAEREYAIGKLKDYNVQYNLIMDKTRPTPLKKRYRCENKSLLRVNNLHERSVSIELQNQIIRDINEDFRSYDLVVFSDFNYGFLPQDLINKLIKLFNSNGIFIAADSQSSSQVGDICRFKNCDLLTPTEHEARISLRNKESGLVVLADELQKQSKARNILLKLGKDGLLIHTLNLITSSIYTDRLPALNNAAVDPAGAGDSFLIVSAMAMCQGTNIWEASCLGSVAAAIQVNSIGNTPITSQNLLEEINQ